MKRSFCTFAAGVLLPGYVWLTLFSVQPQVTQAETWHAEQTVHSVTAGTIQMAFNNARACCRGENKVHVVFTLQDGPPGTNTVWYATLIPGGSWTTVTPFPTATDVVKPTIRLHRSGLMLAWTEHGRANDTLRVAYSADFGTTWGSVHAIHSVPKKPKSTRLAFLTADVFEDAAGAPRLSRVGSTNN